MPKIKIQILCNFHDQFINLFMYSFIVVIFLKYSVHDINKQNHEQKYYYVVARNKWWINKKDFKLSNR